MRQVTTWYSEMARMAWVASVDLLGLQRNGDDRPARLHGHRSGVDGEQVGEGQSRERVEQARDAPDGPGAGFSWLAH
ncbi:hypothetical protein [Microtetraspora sp. NBRC 16547]|uniref:hypothetical protein n=1 Tax=Microtetraspora sp. NBRC 16547 TaxID=3030993 RepID=UPI002552F309|nr:hypothetical protein [Microtetraspora sp. NBRC 16547]